MEKEVYFSLDVEADGPIPAQNSMLSLGLAAFTENGPVGLPEPAVFGVNFDLLPGAMPDPKTIAWWQGQGDAYARTRVDTKAPAIAMRMATGWVREVSARVGRKPVCVAYPATYDFMWWHWYSQRFLAEDIFGFQAFDLKTAAAVVLGLSFKETSKRNFPSSWFDGAGKHTHVASDDASEQGHLFTQIWREARRLRHGKTEG